MSEFFKKQTIASYLIMASALFILVAVILCGVSSAAAGYAMDYLGLVITMSIIAIIAVAGLIFLQGKFDGKSLAIDAILLAIIVMLGVCFALILFERAAVIGYAGVTPGKMEVQAAGNGIASAVLYMLALVMITVAGFFKLSKQTDK